MLNFVKGFLCIYWDNHMNFLKLNCSWLKMLFLFQYLVILPLSYCAWGSQGKNTEVLNKIDNGYKTLTSVSGLRCPWSRSVVSDSLRPSWTVAYQVPPSMGFSRQEHWSELPFPSPMHESEKWKWSHSVVSDSPWTHGLQPTRLLHPGNFLNKSTGVGGHSLLQGIFLT